MSEIKYRIKKHFYDHLFVQLYITLISLPILISWGLPLSVMTFLGNLVFIPFITIFLILSSLIFFTELISIPNTILTNLLNITSKLFIYCLHFGKQSWLIGFATPHPLLIIIIPISTLLVIKYVKKYPIMKLSLLLTVFIGFFYLTKPRPKTLFIPFSKNKLLIKYDQNEEVFLIDHGLFNKKASPENFIMYELKPYLTKKFGSLIINKLVIKPSIRNFKAATTICTNFNIKNIEINFTNIKLNKYGWKCYFELKSTAKKNSIKISKIYDNFKKK